MNNQFIGLNIKKWRSFRGKKQEHFANEIGISRIMLSRYENGKSAVSFVRLHRIANCLDISVEKLLIPFQTTQRDQ
jgi:transcriptional regulator with XRE-family HTH domain